MGLPPSSHEPLARAYLALSDDPAAATAQHSLPRLVVATAASIVLAFATPLAWVSTARGEPRDAPAATVVKAEHAEEDDDGDGSS